MPAVSPDGAPTGPRNHQETPRGMNKFHPLGGMVIQDSDTMLRMRELLLTYLLAAAAFAQTGQFGAFTNSNDVGAPPLKGSAEFDASARQYKITGSGTDIWGKADQFHYVWRELSGDFAVTATAKFLTEGIAH